MTKEIFNKAHELTDDIHMIKYHLRKTKADKHWITISTPYQKEVVMSSRFQNELIEWLEQKLEEYQKEFDELGCG